MKIRQLFQVLTVLFSASLVSAFISFRAGYLDRVTVKQKPSSRNKSKDTSNTKEIKPETEFAILSSSKSQVVFPISGGLRKLKKILNDSLREVDTSKIVSKRELSGTDFLTSSKSLTIISTEQMKALLSTKKDSQSLKHDSLVKSPNVKQKK